MQIVFTDRVFYEHVSVCMMLLETLGNLNKDLINLLDSRKALGYCLNFSRGPLRNASQFHIQIN